MNANAFLKKTVTDGTFVTGTNQENNTGSPTSDKAFPDQSVAELRFQDLSLEEYMKKAERIQILSAFFHINFHLSCYMLHSRTDPF